MSSVANWAYTSWATLWKAKKDKNGKPVFSEPVHFLCGYGSELKSESWILVLKSPSS